MVNCKHKIATFLNNVYAKVGHDPFTIAELGEEFNLKSAIAEARREGYIEKIGNAKVGYRTVAKWRITTYHKRMWLND